MGGLYMLEMPYVLFEWGDDLKSRKDTRHKTTPRIAAQTKSSMVPSGYVKIAIENGH